MKSFKCYIAQKGYYAGSVYNIRYTSKDKDEKSFDSEVELKKLRQAEKFLRDLIKGKQGSEKNIEIKQTVLAILDDETFTGKIEENIMGSSLKASVAVMKVADDLTKALSSVDSDYISSRQDDIRGVANQLISIINDTNDVPTVCSAICALEISPAQLLSIDERLVGGILTEKGSPNSHVSILAENINVPYLYGNHEAVMEAQKAEFIIIDSGEGIVITDPNDEIRKEAMLKMESLFKQRCAEAIQQERDISPCKTKIYANISAPEDIDELIQSEADGVGLFRTEFLFLNKDSIPTEQEQYEAYRAVLEAMGQKEVIIRTMDIGSDKKVSWLNISDEPNPALGMRGIRVSLEHRELFHTQLRALLKANVTGNLKIMFPMITSTWEVEEIKLRVSEVATELAKDGIEVKIPPLGIMVETPAAVMCADELAEKVSFFSIGTNDLTQYTLALDREACGLERYYNPHHNSVLRMIEMTVESGHKHGIEIGVCGQLATDPEIVNKLISYNVNKLSVPIRKVRATRALVSEIEQQINKEKMPAHQTLSSCVSAPADGKLIPMSDIPDPVFSAGILGDCFGILPSSKNIYSPVTGTVTAISDAGHAITIKADNGMEILVHVGIDTVKLGHKAFKYHISCGDTVENNQLIMEANLEMIKSAGFSTMIIVILLSQSD